MNIHRNHVSFRNLHNHSFDDLKNEVEAKLQKPLDILEMAEFEVLYPQYYEHKSIKCENSQGIVNAFHNFFPNLLITISTALNYFDEGNQPDMIWDCYLLLEIYYKIFTLPSALIFAIGTVVSSTATAALLAAGVSVLGLTTLYIYGRWLRSFPSRLTHQIQRIDNRPIKPVIGRSVEIKEILKFQLGSRQIAKKHILVVGDPGTGKTTTLKGAAVKLGQLNPKVAVYDASSALGGNSNKFNNGPIERLTEAVKQLGSFASKSVFIVDELFTTLLQSGNIKNDVVGKLRNFLDKQPISCWASATIKEYEALRKYDHENDSDQAESLFQRFHVIDFRKRDVSKMIKAIVTSHFLSSKGIIQCDHDVPQAAIDLTNKAYPQKKQPRSACDLIDLGIAQVAANLSADSMNSDELERAKAKLSKREAKYALSDRSSNEIHDLKIEIRQIRANIKEIEKQLAKKLECVKKVKELYESIEKDRKKLYDLAQKICSKRNPLLEKKFLYIQFWKLPKKLEKIRRNEDEIGPDYPLRVTKEVLMNEISKTIG